MDSIPRAFPLVFLSLVYRMNREKRSEVVRRKLCCSAFVFYTAFPTDCVSGEGRGVQGGASLLWMGPDTGLAGCALPETRNCLEAHPQDLLFVFRLWHWLLRHLHFDTIMSLKKQHTHTNNVFFFFTFVKKKCNQISNGSFMFQEFMRSD